MFSRFRSCLRHEARNSSIAPGPAPGFPWGQPEVRASIRWIVNAIALSLVYHCLFQTSWHMAILIGITVGLFSGLLQYHTRWLKAFYESDILANRCAVYARPHPSVLFCVRWFERFARWFLVELLYVFYSETVRAYYGIPLLGSACLTSYITLRLLSALFSTASQGAWELMVNYWRDSLVQRGRATVSQADIYRDWLFLLGSVISVSSLAASASVNPTLGFVGFGLLVAGATYCGVAASKTR